MFNSTSNIIYSNVYLKVKQVSFECARPNWCKKHNSVSRKTYSFLEVSKEKLEDNQSGIVISFDNLDQNKSLTNRCTSFRTRDITW